MRSHPPSRGLPSLEQLQDALSKAMDYDERDRLQEAIRLMDLRKIHLKNLERLEGQAGKHGMTIPIPLLSGIEHEKDEIAKIEGELAALDPWNLVGISVEGNFMAAYIERIQSGASPGEIGTWLLAEGNARRMDKAMFFDPANNWFELGPFHILVLRACTPNGVFIQTAVSGYLARVQGKPDYSRIADSMFEDDYTFVTHLGDFKHLRPQILALMRMTYDYGIRPGDPRVKAM